MNKFEKIRAEFLRGSIKPAEYQKLLQKLVLSYIKQEKNIFARKNRMERAGIVTEAQADRHKSRKAELEHFDKLVETAGHAIQDINSSFFTH